MNARRGLAVAAVGLGLALAGCQTTRVTLVRDEDGKGAGAVAVLDPKTEAERGELGKADFTVANSRFEKGFKPRPAKRGFADLFNIMPQPPIVRELTFETGTTTVTDASKPVLTELLQLWQASRQNAEIQIIGYTDTVGGLEENDALSLRRAQAVRDMLANEGFKFTPDNSRVTGRGERELAVKTPDETDEPRNRRVLVVIR